jgi:hypothetical protein
MRPGAVSYKQCARGIFGHFGSDNFAVRQIDSTCHVALLEERRAADVQKHEAWMGAPEGLVGVPAIRLKGEFRFEVPNRQF